jgi:hypothetical protein
MPSQAVVVVVRSQQRTDTTRIRLDARVQNEAGRALATGDERARGLRLLLLGKGAVFAQRFERSLSADMDESEQSPGARGPNMLLAAPFHRCGRLAP